MRLRTAAMLHGATFFLAGCAYVNDASVHGVPGRCDDGGECMDASRDAGPPTDAYVAPDTTCAAVRLSTSSTTPNVILLVDRSGSMSDPFDVGGSRWNVLENALVGEPGAPGGLVQRLQGTVRFGLALFDGETMCPNLVTVLPPVLANYPAIEATYAANEPGGSTPTGLAITTVVTRLSTMAVMPGPKIIVLATDGEPNDCSSSSTSGQALTVAAAAAAHAQGYTIDAIGVASDVALANLEAVATAGGGTAVSVGDTTALVTALDSIVTGVISCNLTLSGMIDPTMACDGDVELDGMPLVCNGPNGWHAVDMNHITLDGSACVAIHHAGAEVTATFPCHVIFTPTH